VAQHASEDGIFIVKERTRFEQNPLGVRRRQVIAESADNCWSSLMN